MESVGQGGSVYRVHDYAYVAPAVEETSSKNHIMRVERLFKNSDGETFARGFWCYRPEETFHLATKKFLENVRNADFILLTKGFVIYIKPSKEE